MRLHPIWKKTLISLLILVVFVSVQKINTPITNQIISRANQVLNLEWDYSALWQKIRPLTAKVLTRENWVSLQQMAKIRFKMRDDGSKENSLFLDLEGQ